MYKVRFPEADPGETLSGYALAGNLTVRVNDFLNDNGKAFVALYSGPMEWAPDKSRITAIKDGSVEVRFENLPFAEYAVIAFQDENGNLDVDQRNGVPTEALG